MAAASPPLTGREAEDRIRWSAVQAATILSAHPGALLALVDGMNRDESVTDELLVSKAQFNQKLSCPVTCYLFR